jgi:hypothetical protein
MSEKATPVSRPAVQPQPASVSYGVQLLWLFKSYSRETYAKEFGTQAPPFNPEYRVKTWFDSTVDLNDPEALVSYRTVAQDKAGNWSFRSVSMTAKEAASVNLPGDFEYPAYVVEPTRASRGGSPLNPEYLSTREQAEELLAQIGTGVIVDDGQTPVYPAMFPVDEPRRMWAISINGLNHNAGLLLKMQNEAGVGRPGHWQMSGADPIWIPQQTGPNGKDDTRPPREMPMRELFANEKLQPGMFGISVARTDLAPAADGMGFTAADRKTLHEILDLLQSRV